MDKDAQKDAIGWEIGGQKINLSFNVSSRTIVLFHVLKGICGYKEK
jgi:hypothetical protein